jgi:hypothetical protein
VRPEWAKVPITFTEEDFKLKSAIHNDARTCCICQNTHCKV